MPAIHRHRPWFAVAAAAGLTALLSGAVGAAHDSGERVAVLAGPLSAEVVEVVDGDTLDVRVTIWLGQDLRTRVRVDGVDTPELRGRCPRETEMAQEAKRFVARFLAEGAVLLHDIQNDKYGGRVRARVIRPGGDDLAQALIRAGLARAYGGDARQPWCAMAEAR